MSPRTIRVSILGIVGAYLLAASLAVWPAANLLITAWPPQPGSASWRFGFSGLISDVHSTVLLGLFLAMVVALYQGQRFVLRSFSVLALLGALGLLLVLVFFPLDVLQVTGGGPDEARSNLYAAGLSSELKHFVAFLTYAFLGLGGWRSTALKLWEGAAAASGDRSSDLLVKPSKRPSEKTAEAQV